MHTSFLPRPAALAGLLLAGLAALPVSASTTTLTFDNLPGETDSLHDADYNPLSTANGGSNVLDGVTFNTTANPGNPIDWEIIGRNFQSTPGTDYGTPHSGDYYLAGNAYKGLDNLGNAYTGLTFSTNQALESLWIGADDVFTGSSPTADKVTITAYGATGDLASLTTPLTNNAPDATPADPNPLPSLTFLDTSAVFGGLTGVTGYRFETEAVSLNAQAGQAYVLADDLTLSTPVPEASTTVSLGLLLALGLGGVFVAARKKKAA